MDNCGLVHLQSRSAVPLLGVTSALLAGISWIDPVPRLPEAPAGKDLVVLFPVTDERVLYHSAAKSPTDGKLAEGSTRHRLLRAPSQSSHASHRVDHCFCPDARIQQHVIESARTPLLLIKLADDRCSALVKCG